ncbi:AAA family ATPase [Pararhodobacter sp.]|uniref:AAA family ATPase n=1 Tax=Pararhodobacter sp. TaxID=2127056 RepID=UPI002AFF4DED|nr:AAA family ATPase [Pararhodobacter sp.]
MDNHRVYLKSLTLKDVGPFSDLTVEINPGPGLNLICGGNGIGKTTILEAVVACFSQGRNHKLKRRQSAERGSVHLQYLADDESRVINLNIENFDPEKGDFSNYQNGLGENIVNVRAFRDFSYMKQVGISSDPDFNQKEFGHRAANDPQPSEIKSWLTNRYLLRPHADKSSWSEEMKSNLITAERIFSLLDERVALSEVDVRTFDVMVSTPGGVIPFEFLSSGFRSAFSLLLGILKEIEFRKLEVAAENFSGVILIDEVDLHLHPTWQQQIGGILKKTFPRAQIIATTHSPHVVQAASPEEVIALVAEDDERVKARSVPQSKFGYLGWTIEEVLEDIMGVEDTRTATFRAVMRAFDGAIEAEDEAKIRHALADLEEMLHPNNPLRKLLRIQVAPFLTPDQPENKKID